MPANRRLLWIGATLVVAIVALVVVRSGTEPAASPNPPRAGAARAAAQAENEAPPSELQLEALAAARGEPTEQGRNPFRFRPRVVEAPTPVRRLPGIQDDQVGAPPPRSTGPPPPPPITLKFIGVVTKADGTRIAVLSDGTRPIHGQEGDELEGRYKILKIGVESLEIAYLDGRGRQTIRLTGQ